MKSKSINCGIVAISISLLFCTTNLLADTNVWEEVKKLLASNASEQDWFGWSVAVAGDVAVVGAYKEDSGGVNAGSAYIFEQNEGGINAWNQVKKLSPSGIIGGNFFGSSVAMSGNLAVIGATGVDTATNSTGVVYIFERNSGGTNNWGEVKILTASDAQAYDYFGQAVSIFENMLIVGTVNEKAYIFERNQGGTNAWGEIKILTASDAETGDWFGRSVGIGADLAIVGAKNKTAVYIFERNQGGVNNWGEIKKLTAYASNFGVSVAIAENVALVGADGGSGTAYIFEQNTGGANNWGQVKQLIASDPGTFDQFGSSVAVNGNVAVIGAPFKDYGVETFAGAAYVFEKNSGGPNAWGQAKKLLAANPGNSDLFGNSVSVDGGIAIVGAYNDRERGHQAGAAYIFESAAPPSEMFDNAPYLPDNTEIASGNNIDAITEPGEPEHAGNGGPYHSVWWDWSSSTNELLFETEINDLLFIDTHGSDFDTVLAVYTGPTVSNLTQIAASDDSGPGIETSEVSFQFNSGETYHIVVDGKTTSDTGNVVLNYAIIPEGGGVLIFGIFILFFWEIKLKLARDS